jgi:hypothetical protein
MSNNKQSSIELLEIELEKLWIEKHLSPITIKSLIEQAKEIHEEEICNAHYEGQKSDRLSFTWDDHPEYWSSEYYLNTFKRKNK